MEQIYTPKADYKVWVRCMTYNQSQYIEDALNGFAIQETVFPFACLVMDDSSTDGEPEIIKAWMDRECNMEKAENVEIEKSFITIVPHKKNPTCVFAFYFLKENLYKKGGKDELIAPWRDRCEYEAICEGDDFWTEKDKLQMQVDCLESNKNVSFCHTGFDIFKQNVGKIQDGLSIAEQNCKLHSLHCDLIGAILENTYRVQTMTTMIRISSLNRATEVLRPYAGMFLMGDTQLWIALLTIGEVYFFPEKTSIYREHEGSNCRQSDMKKRLRFSLSCAEMRVVMAEAFNQSDTLKRKFHKEYHNKLNLYLCYDYKYETFVDLKFISIKDYLQFHILKSSIVRPILKSVYQNRYSHIQK